MNLQLALALASGIGIAAASGLRAFLPLFAVGVAARLGWIPLHPGSEWLASDPALWALGCATVLEIAGDKIPVVDHALDVIGTVLRPAAAFLGGYAVLWGWGEPWAQIASIALGAGAVAIHAAKAKTRLGSTAVSLGHANPILSVLEDLTSVGLLVVAILAPLAVLVLVVLLVWLMVRFRRGSRSPAPTPPVG
jgi:hypothetical protein